MKKFMMLIGLLLLVGCGNDDGELKVSVNGEPTYQEGERTEITLQVNQGDKAVEDVAIDGTMEMAKMDHGIIEVHFEENGDGTYTGSADLPMAGEWVLNVTAKQGDKTYQSVLTFDVK